MEDAVVIGSGPNGFAAAITLARAGRSVLLLEGQDTLGGGARSGELTLPGFTHDLCSAVHPLAVASPFFQSLPLESHGLKWINPPIALAHPFDDGSASCLYSSLEKTAESLGPDGDVYQKWMRPFQKHSKTLFEDLLRPVGRVPRYPWLTLKFGFWSLLSAKGLADRLFETEKAKGFFGGLAAHSILPLSKCPSSAIGLMLALAGHAVGWPFPQGGSQQIANALASYFRELGGKIEMSHPIRTVQDIPKAKAVFFDLHPRQLLKIAGDLFPKKFQKKIQKFRLGPAVFKVDWALSTPVPWKNPECRKAGTLHLGGSLSELLSAEQAPWNGKTAEKPFVLAAQPSVFDTTRAPSGQHTLWGYTHVPRGSTENMTERIENQIERYAPGFKKLILAKKETNALSMERRNPNYIGGDISGGAPDLWQILFRPTLSLTPYATPVSNWFLCSASTPPGAGVHGLCGLYAARFALKRGF